MNVFVHSAVFRVPEAAHTNREVDCRQRGVQFQIVLSATALEVASEVASI